MKSKVFAFPVFTFGTSVTPRIFWILWISLKGSQNLYKWSVQDLDIFWHSARSVGMLIHFRLGGSFTMGGKAIDALRFPEGDCAHSQVFHPVQQHWAEYVQPFCLFLKLELPNCARDRSFKFFHWIWNIDYIPKVHEILIIFDIEQLIKY